MRHLSWSLGVRFIPGQAYDQATCTSYFDLDTINDVFPRHTIDLTSFNRLAKDRWHIHSTVDDRFRSLTADDRNRNILEVCLAKLE